MPVDNAYISRSAFSFEGKEDGNTLHAIGPPAAGEKYRTLLLVFNLPSF